MVSYQRLEVVREAESRLATKVSENTLQTLESQEQ